MKIFMTVVSDVRSLQPDDHEIIRQRSFFPSLTLALEAMCTLTLIPVLAQDGGQTLRLAFNRDELRSRPAALPPTRARFGEHDAVMPIDPVSHGTWIAASSAGIVFALLNGNSQRRVAKTSRGTIIPRLLALDVVDDAAVAAMRLPFPEFDSFRLLILDLSVHFEIAWDGEGVSMSTAPLTEPFMTTSSSFGETIHDSRRKLFEEMLAHHATAEEQDAFHDHRWEDRPEISVNMERDEAVTVSRTIVTLSNEEATLFYRPLAGDSSTLTLPIDA
jgi:uncharacterized protein with NRDE domain